MGFARTDLIELVAKLPPALLPPIALALRDDVRRSILPLRQL